MKTLICIGLVWCAIAFATAWFWHRLRRHEKWMESEYEEFFKNISSEDIPPEFAKIANDNFWDLIKKDDTDSATFMGMDKAEELTKAQLDRLTEKEEK